MRALLATLLSIVTLALACAAPARAQQGDEAVGGSFLTPFPDNDIYKLQVLGDWWGDGLLSGLVEALGSDQRLQITRQRHAVNGINRNDFEDSISELEAELAKARVNIAVVMLGQADRTSLRVPGMSRRAPVGSEEWRAEYGRRLDRMIRVLKKHNVSVYWVGLPTLRRGDANDDAQVMNEIIRERASLNGVRYVDAFGGFASDSGGYDNYGPDITGKNRVLRDSDGVGFTQVGYRKLAHFVEREIRRDLQTAIAERSIPLAGSESEQTKVNAALVQARQAAAQPKPGAVPQGAPPIGGWQNTVSGPAAAAKGSERNAATAAGDYKAEHGRIALKQVGANGREETVTLDILRPALASTVIAAVTRRESPDKPSQMGDSIGTTLPGGLTVLSSVTPANETAATRRRVAASQTPYFRLLVKGERLMPKPGRADDHTWPRPEPPTVTPVTASGSRQQETSAPEKSSRRTRRSRSSRDDDE